MRWWTSDLSSIEIKHIAIRLNSLLSEYYVYNIYPVDVSTILLRLHHGEKGEKRLILSAPKGLWLTKYDITRERVKGMAATLRREIPRARIRKIAQLGGERIAVLEFEGKERVRKVILELFGGGNIVVTDEGGRIVSALRRLKVRHRKIAAGETYTLPPARGVDVTALRPEDLAPLRESSLEAARWLGRNVALSRKYVEEALRRAEIDGQAAGRSLSEEAVSRLYRSLMGVVDMVVEGAVEPTVFYRDGEPIDAAPFRLEAYRGVEAKTFGSFIEALDEVFTFELQAERRRLETEPMRRRLEEVRRSIEEQVKAEEGSLRAAEALKGYAGRLMGVAYSDPSLRPSKELLTELGAVDVVLMKGVLSLLVQGMKVEAEGGWSLMKLASHIFDEAKRLERKVEAIRRAHSDLKAQLEGLQHQLGAAVAASAEKPAERREKAWYERYRWFKTSEGLLAVGGRDASTNSIIVRRYAGEGCIVFHADLHGSPFFVLEGYDPSRQKSVREVAQAVVAFSSAWRDGLSAADAYWVKPDQVKRQAPSGMYLPRGAFLIEGVKNYVKGLKVECAVGLARVGEGFIVVSGPPEAVARSSAAYVVLTPEGGKASDAAKKVRAELAEVLKEHSGLVKRVSVDEFLRAMPPGAGIIVSKRLGEQRY